jgi:DNA repair exonuclease SbcCD nuclease subunit
MEFNSAKIAYPYLVISDIHLHNWSQFSYTLPNGRNNRLQHTLDAISEAATKLKEVGGEDIVITGDLFHTRGNVKPSVLNPTVDLFEELTKNGFKIYAEPGNHDLEGINSDTLGNAMHSLNMLSNFTCFTVPTETLSGHLFIPWYEDSAKVLKLANERSKQNPKLTLFAHVGLNGVIPANLGNTLNPADFDESFKYVFCGHFHNHVAFDARVFSVGALTHQTWSDVGSKAGYLIVYEDRVEQYESSAPTFVRSMGSGSVSFHNKYVRLEGIYSPERASQLKEEAGKEGALAVLDQTTRPTIIEKKHEEVVKVDLGLETALESYCKHTFGDKWQKVYDECVKLK